MAKRSRKSAPNSSLSTMVGSVRDHLNLRPVVPYVVWAVAVAAWVLVTVSLATYSPADPLPAGSIGGAAAPFSDQPHNLVGRFGAALSHRLYLMFGPGVWILIAGWVALMAAYALRRKPTQMFLRTVGVALMCIATSAICNLASIGAVSGAGGSGGLIAGALNVFLLEHFNTFGASVIVIVGFWTGAILAMDQVVMAASRRMGIWLLALRHLRVPKPVLVGRLHWPWRLSRAGAGVYQGSEAPGQTSTLRLQPMAVSTPMRRRTDVLASDTAPEGATAILETDLPSVIPTKAAESADDVEVDIDDIDDVDGTDAPGAYIAQKKFDPEALCAKIKQLPINFAAKASQKSASQIPGAGAGGNLTLDLSGYRFPPLELLNEPESNFNAEMEKVVRDQAVRLEAALQQYRIDGEVVGIDSGPVITLYEVRLAPGTKVSALGGVASDLAPALKSHAIRIVPNTVGKDTVGVEVPNAKKERVRLKELMTANADLISRMKLPMFLGKDASGNPLIGDLADMPHMLIAGTTGSGKSVCMNSIIMSFLFTKRPDELKMVLVDPKMVELSMFKDVPHLMCPVVTEMSKAAAILEWATTKMDERYELLAEAAVRDIAGYNGLTWEELKERFQPASESEEARIPRKLPYLVFVIDEMADLMLTNKEVEGFIVRLAQKARAVGIHLILATQRPQANVVTGLIKGNMPCRISFKVASGLDSRIVLDQKGAEVLLGQGDMLYLSPRTSKLVRAQGTLIDDAEIRRVVNFLKNVAQQNFEPQLIQLRAPAAIDEDGEEVFESDPLFNDAVKIVLETKRGSVSLLQRRLTVGYARASRLIEQMASIGILGDYKGSQAREVVMDLEEWEALRAQAEADAKAAESASASGPPAEPGAEGVDGDDAVPDEFDDEYRR